MWSVAAVRSGTGAQPTGLTEAALAGQAKSPPESGGGVADGGVGEGGVAEDAASDGTWRDGAGTRPADVTSGDSAERRGATGGYPRPGVDNPSGRAGRSTLPVASGTTMRMVPVVAGGCTTGVRAVSVGAACGRIERRDCRLAGSAAGACSGGVPVCARLSVGPASFEYERRTGVGATGVGAIGVGATGLGVTGLGVTGLGVTGLGVTGLGVTATGGAGVHGSSSGACRAVGDEIGACACVIGRADTSADAVAANAAAARARS
ncbi:hypothetical protein [Pengzhenrongella phosphoraccumulans]|uniref:hypothetical protein n=1 Tax=Pengzhenrongella phosphoraccumulans TaxID=3114394 RepID=UPI00388DA5C1